MNEPTKAPRPKSPFPFVGHDRDSRRLALGHGARRGRGLLFGNLVIGALIGAGLGIGIGLTVFAAAIVIASGKV